MENEERHEARKVRRGNAVVTSNLPDQHPNDVIAHRTFARVFQAVKIVGGEENDGSCRGLLDATVDHHFQDAFLHNDEFLIGVPVRFVRALEGVKRRRMALEVAECLRGRIEKWPDMPHGRGDNCALGPIEDLRSQQGTLR